MKKSMLLTVLLTALCGVFSVLAKPSAVDVAKAAELAARIKNPAVKAALQCRIASAATLASIHGNGQANVKNSRAFWSSYSEKLNGINVSGCPEEFKAAFNAHVKAVKTLLDAQTDTPNDGNKFLDDQVKRQSTTNSLSPLMPNKAGGHMQGQYNALPDCERTYQAVFAAANKVMSKTPAPGDGELASQIDKALGE